MTIGTLVRALAAGAQAPVPPAVASDLARDLAGQIATAVAPARAVHLEALVDASAPSDEGAWRSVREVEAVLASELRARGIRVETGPAANAVALVLRCGRNLRDRVCTVDLQDHDTPRTWLAARRDEAGPRAGLRPVATLQVRPVFAGRAPLLDLVVRDRELIVLDTGGLALYGQSDDGWRPRASQPIALPGAWPRDPRGRLVADGGGGIDAFVPGLACHGTTDPFLVTCGASRAAWPVGPENGGLAPGRNSFTGVRTPPFFSAAPAGDRANARWILVGLDGTLLLLDEELQVVQEMPWAGTEVVALDAACGFGRVVVLSEPVSAANTSGDSPVPDAVRAFDVVDRRLVPLTAPAVLPGPLTALWPRPDGTSALAVSRSLESDRYEAFEIRFVCVR